MIKLGIIGTTTWGTTLAIISAREGRSSTLLARSSKEAHLLIEDGENRRFVPGISFPEGVSVTESPDRALSDADVVIFVYREAYYLERKEPTPATVEHAEWQSKMSEISNRAEIIIGKQRHGPTGNVFLEFEAQFTKFKDLQNN